MRTPQHSNAKAAPRHLNCRTYGVCQSVKLRQMNSNCLMVWHGDGTDIWILWVLFEKVNAFSERDVFVFTRFTYAKIIAASLQVSP